MQGTQLISHLPAPTCSTAPDKIVIEPTLPRLSRTAPTAYPPPWSRDQLELPQYQHGFGLELTRLPTRNSMALGLECSSAEDISLPASDDTRPADSSSLCVLRAFIDDLQTDRERSESATSSENNHSSAIELGYSSDTPTSAHRLKSSTASKACTSSSTSGASGLPTIVISGSR